MDTLNNNPGQTFVVWQDRDIREIEEKLLQEFPGNRDKVRGALELCREYVKPSDGREMMMECVRSMLK